ncbi:MAG: carbohydrate porin, partial [Terrimicrobiaceae bacterium]
MLMRDGFSALIRGSLFRSFPSLLITRSQSGMGPPMAARSHTVIATIVLLACAMPRPAHAENTEGVQNLSLSLFLVFPKRRGTRQCRVFIDYCGVFQGNPIGGKSQNFAYSQYLPFGFEWREPFGWRGSALRVSAVSGAGRDLSKSIGNAFTVSQAWDGNTLYLYQAYLVQKAFDDQLEIGIGRVSAAQFFATLPAFDLLVNGG